MHEHYKKLNILYLERVLDIEKMFARNVAYISLASIIISLLFLYYIHEPMVKAEKNLDGLCFLFMAWGFFVASSSCVAVMTFYSAIFKDTMFEGTLLKAEDDSHNLYKERSHWSGSVVYIFAGLASLLFIIALICLLWFMGQALLTLYS